MGRSAKATRASICLVLAAAFLVTGCASTLGSRAPMSLATDPQLVHVR